MKKKYYSNALLLGMILGNVLLVLTAACGQVDMSASPEKSPSAMEEHVANELLVKFKEGISSEGMTTIHSKMGTEVIQVMADGLLYQVSLPATANLSDVKKSYEALPEVEYVEVNFVVGIEDQEGTK